MAISVATAFAAEGLPAEASFTGEAGSVVVEGFTAAATEGAVNSPRFTP